MFRLVHWVIKPQSYNNQMHLIHPEHYIIPINCLLLPPKGCTVGCIGYFHGCLSDSLLVFIQMYLIVVYSSLPSNFIVCAWLIAICLSVFLALAFLYDQVEYPNNSIFYLLDIGENNSAISCITNLSTCCTSEETGSNVSLGNWYQPNGDRIVTVSSRSAINSNFTVTRGRSVIHLHHSNNTTEPNGRFTCEIPDSDGIVRYLYAGNNCFLEENCDIMSHVEVCTK